MSENTPEELPNTPDTSDELSLPDGSIGAMVSTDDMKRLRLAELVPVYSREYDPDDYDDKADALMGYVSKFELRLKRLKSDEEEEIREANINSPFAGDIRRNEIKNYEVLLSDYESK